jgi:hypothetical protein
MNPPPRRPGAPKGNLNNFKHGFYSRRIRKRQLDGIETSDAYGLTEEIALIRVFTRQLIESFNPDADFIDLADILRILCLASATISRIARTQCLLTSTGRSKADEALEIAIERINEEMRRKKQMLDHAL